MQGRFVRIAAWAIAGMLVSAGWGLYFAAANKAAPIGPAVDLLARLTQPGAGIALYLKPSLAAGLTSIAAANAATYALIGLIVEMFRRRVTSQPS